jgi:hypothetical protein
MPRGPITSGVDHNFFQKVIVTATSFPADSDVVMRFRGAVKTLTMVNEGASVIEYSFNGNTLHGDMTPGTPTAALSFDNRPMSKIWFRTAGGPATVRVEAWSVA